MDAGDVGGQAIEPPLQHRQQARPRIARRHRQLVGGGGDVERGLERDGRHRAVAQGLAGGVELGTDRAQRPGGALQDLAAGGVAAEQVDVEAAGEERVAQVDDAQQDRDVALPARALRRRIEEVARLLQPLGQCRFTADPRGQRRRFAGADPKRDQHVGPGAEHLRRRPQGGDQHQRPVAPLQHDTCQQRPGR